MRLGFDIILLGDPTAGKDTQAGILMKKYDLKPVESGNYWRDMLKKKGSEGDLIRKTMGLGHPAPVNLMKKFLEDHVKNVSAKKNLIFIGNPRLKPEAQFLVKILRAKKRDFFVLYFKLPQKEIFRRALIRRTQEADDEVKTKRRIQWHKTQVSKTVKYFQSMHKLKFINSVPPIPQVAKNIQKTIDDYQRSPAN